MGSDLPTNTGGLRLALANPGVRRLEGALAATAIGNPMYAFALAVWAFHRGGAPMLSLFALGTLLPAGVLAPFLAALADRFRPERVLVAALLARGGALAGVALALTGVAYPPLILALAATGSLAGRVVYPAQAALLPSVARRPEELVAANALPPASTTRGRSPLRR